MCGIAGIAVCPGELANGRELLQAMLDDLGHRGPDGAGMFVAADVALGHRRLAVLDLSDRGRQPMTSRDGRWTIVLNGEIFNYTELRDDLSEYRGLFRSATDTEVLLEACAAWGVEKALERSNGMFAFALWDSRERELILARDRVGEKPLVYTLGGSGRSTLAFASELKALRRLSEGRLDPEAVDAYLALGYVPAPLSIFRDCRKLPAGHLLRFRNGDIAVRRWWFPENARASAAGMPPGGTANSSKEMLTRLSMSTPASAAPETAWSRIRPARTLPAGDKAGQLRELLGDAVRIRLRADVPVALLLSGGVDSSVIAAECARLGAKTQAFTVIFDGDYHSDTDGRYAVMAARHFDLEHETVEVSARSIADQIENILRHYDEPFADSSALPSLALARALGGRYKVALNGDGGDEAFGGYRHYERIRWTQAAKAVAAAAGLVDGRGARALGRYVESKALFRTADRGRLMNGHAGGHRENSFRALIGRDEFLAQACGGALKRALWSDRHLYLANDLTYKMDIALGAHGIEGRGPFLDHRVIEWAQRLDARDLVQGARKKILLRAAYRGIVPDEILDRPKLGFGAPLGRWLAGPLAPFARDLGTCPLLERIPKERLGADRTWALVAFANWARQWKATW